ncbi:MAG TPA: type II toxin-antitoxin system VapC family toxin [Phycisphaerae bacterium]|nr:type II toxin-antitoxin system VapC family toxin [Phycisphaerae bacterium]
MAYIDTSVLVAYYCPERLSRSVQKTLGKVREPAISPLVEVELYSAVAAKVRAKELQATAGRRILALFQGHLADGCYGVVPIETAEYRLALEWIGGFSSPLRAADGLHLAAAFANDLTLLTADRVLARSADHFGVRYKLIA